MMNRSYSCLNIRTVDEEKRVIEGVATTPVVARDGDILLTEGIQFKLPIPFLYRHKDPFGNVVAAKVTTDGITVRIQVGAAGISAAVDEQWRLVKSGLVRYLSIGWRTLQETYDKEIGGFRILKSEWLELSAVPVGADPNATMTSVRSIDEADLAALGIKTAPSRRTPSNQPGDSGTTNSQGRHMKSFATQITELETKRADVVARMAAIMDSADNGIISDEAEQRQYDALTTESDTLDKNIMRLRAHEKNVTGAKPVTSSVDTPAAPARVTPGVSVEGPKLEKGIPFARLAIALFAAKGDRQRAAQYVESNSRWMGQTPELARILRAAVEVGNTTTSGWASQLAPLEHYTGDFVEFLRPQTLVGRITGFRMVPFNVSIKTQDAGTEGDWVGQGARKPVGKLNFDAIELKITKCAKIVAMTEELVRLATPSVEALVRQDLADGLKLAIDKAFIDEGNSGTSNIKPASVLNSAANDSASGPSSDELRADVKLAFEQFTTNNIPLSGLCWVMQETQAVALAMMLNALGQPEFPGMSVNGGTLFGFPVYTSQSVNSGVIGLIKPSEILLADDGAARIDMSNQATLVMDDGGSPESTQTVSLWQENAIGIRAERFINWKLRRTDAAYYITGADYGGIED